MIFHYMWAENNKIVSIFPLIVDIILSFTLIQIRSMFDVMISAQKNKLKTCWFQKDIFVQDISEL